VLEQRVAAFEIEVSAERDIGISGCVDIAAFTFGDVDAEMRRLNGVPFRWRWLPTVR